MSTIKAQFDGRAFVPEGPVDLPVESWVEIPGNPVKATEPSERPLMKLLELLNRFPDDPGSNAPGDLAEQHDYYLYGTAKQISAKPAVDESELQKPPLHGLSRLAALYPENPDWSEDGAAQHDLYLRGIPKRS